MEQSKTKTKILTEQGIFQPTTEMGAAMQAYADQEKRKEAISFLNSVTEDGCTNYFRIGDKWFLGDEDDDDPEGPFTSEQLYDLYLQQTQNQR